MPCSRTESAPFGYKTFLYIIKESVLSEGQCNVPVLEPKGADSVLEKVELKNVTKLEACSPPNTESKGGQT